MQLEDAMKILGACIHFKTEPPPGTKAEQKKWKSGARCAVRKCKTSMCKVKTTTRFCEECQDNMLDRACAMPLPTLDKIAAVNSRVLSSMRYGISTCEEQQHAWRRLGIKLRRRLQGFGHGGYKAAAALRAKLGGLGIENTESILAQETTGILERALNRDRMLRNIVTRLASTGHPWPKSLAKSTEVPRRSLRRRLGDHPPIVTY